jgi:hypothetical protein
MAYTLLDIRTQVRTLINEPTSSFWTDGVLRDYINEGIRTIAQRSGCYRTIQTVYTVASTRTVSFDGYKCIAVEYSNKALIKITPVQVGHAKLDGVHPQYFYEYNNTIGIEPVPPEAYALTIYTIDIPYPILDETDTPNLPYDMQGLIAYFAASKALAQDRRRSESMQFMNMFQNELEFMSRNILPNIPDGVEDLRFR